MSPALGRSSLVKGAKVRGSLLNARLANDRD
jgi:hypothetical protein